MLTPEDLQCLASLCDPSGPADFAARPDLADFLDRPEVQAHLAATLTVHDIRYNTKLQQATLAAVEALQEVVAQTEDLTEKRRAATSILRTTRQRTRSCHRGRLDNLGTPTATNAHHASNFRTPTGLLHSTPGAPPVHIPPHFKRLNTFVYSDTPSRSLTAKQAVANALALIQQGDSNALQTLFNHCTHRGRFGAHTPEKFESLAQEIFEDDLGFQAVFAAPLVQQDRQHAHQDVIIIPKSGEPAAFTIHLRYPMFGDNEYCWLISHYSTSKPLSSKNESAAPQTHPDSS